MKPFHIFLVALTLSLVTRLPTPASTYKVGDIVTEVTNLVDRATGQPVPLSRLEGHVLFIDFFAHWCPVCRAAAPQILRDIGDWYKTRDGNPQGVPVLHIGANLQADNSTANRNATTTFIETYRIPLTIQDTSRRLQGRFGPTSGQPTFVIINGVTNSPSHRPWELLYARFSYQDSTQSRPIDAFRAAIDSVEPGPPFLHGFSVQPDGSWEFTVSGAARRPLLLEWTETLAPPDWRPLGNEIPADTTFPYRLPAASNSPGGFLRVRPTR